MIKNKCPDYIIMEFEIAPIKAFKEIFPLVKVFYCFFHFSQNIWRYIQKNGLVVRYKNDKEFRIHIKMLLALAFVPKKNIFEIYEKLKMDYLEKFNGKSEISVFDYFE
ncbi:hypothetical protein DMUE_3164, partial [Dictyocoela muelleri]